MMGGIAAVFLVTLLVVAITELTRPRSNARTTRSTVPHDEIAKEARCPRRSP